MPKNITSQLKVYELGAISFNPQDFCCGRTKYDEYIRNEAESDHQSGIGKVWLFVYKRKVVGYVTLAMSHLDKQKHVKLKNITNHGKIPSLLLGQMARDQQYRNYGLGEHMIGWVINKAFELTKHVGCRLLILDSERDKVEKYKSWGFEHIPRSKRNKQDTMFLDLSWLH